MKKSHLKISVFFILLFIGKNISSQIISTIAGTGVAGYNNDNILATNALLNKPGFVATDTLGNIYISEYNNHRIRKVNSSGIITTIAGTGVNGYSGDGGLAINAKIKGVVEICISNSNDIYIADNVDHRIRKIDQNGIITTFAGNGFGGFSGDGGLATNAKLYVPDGLAIDQAGNVYISDWYNFRIRKVNSSGIISTFAGTGTGGHLGDGGIANSAQLLGPTGIFIDSIGNIYFTETGDYLRKINTAGIISTIAGTGSSGYSGDGGLCINASLSGPYDVCIDKLGNIYIADQGNQVIRKISPASITNTIDNTTLKEVDFNIFPNPANESISIETKNKEKNTVIIYNSLGEITYKSDFELNLNIDLTSFSSGLYIINLQSGKKSLNKKIFKN